MPRRPRSSTARHYYHVINRAAGKSPLFTRSRDYREFLGILREGLAKHPAPLVAFCIMSNHWHLVVGPMGTKSLSRLMHWVSTTHAVRFRRRQKTLGEGPVYQGRFKSHPIEEAGSLVRICRYVERNALTAGLVRRAQDWPWGSLADRRRPDPTLPLTGASFLASDAWADHVNAVVTVKELLERPVPETSKSVENRPVPHHAEAPGGGGKGGEKGVRAVRGAHGHEADAHVERAKHFRVVKLAGALKPGKQRRNRPTLAVK
jgi:putative transposase